MSKQQGNNWGPVLLRWSDQSACAGLIVISLVVIATSWAYRGGLQGRLIEVDRAPRMPVQFQLDMNQAEWEEWSVLPGIGPILAQRIVDFRKLKGPFRSQEDLLEVPGIGPRILDRLRPYLLPVDSNSMDAISRP